MLRQISTIILALFYLVISTGFTLNAHYCAGKMVDIQLFSQPEHCCSKAKSCHKDASKCCDDQSIVVQLDQWQLPSTLPLYQVDVIVAPTLTTTDSANVIQDQQEGPSSIVLPPPKSSDLWLLYHKLTLYD
ncbi:MAG: hypothetical protein IPL46_05370 [Saprospiraceae bacterium]|nr:hypothetical protein [Saprospiraceae bacterium]